MAYIKYEAVILHLIASQSQHNSTAELSCNWFKDEQFFGRPILNLNSLIEPFINLVTNLKAGSFHPYHNSKTFETLVKY